MNCYNKLINLLFKKNWFTHYFLLLAFSFLSLEVRASHQKSYLFGLFDHKFLTDSFRQDLRKGILLALDEEKYVAKEADESFVYGGDEITSHFQYKQFKSSVASIGVGAAKEFSKITIGKYGLFDLDKKIEADDFFNLLISLDYKQASWEKVLSNIYKAKKIVLLVEDLDFIDRNLPRLEKLLNKEKISIVNYVVPRSNNLAIKSAVTQLKKHEFDLILVINEFNKSIKFINMADRLGVDVPILFLSLDLMDKSDKNWSFFPSPYDSHSKIGKQYLEAIDLLSGKNRGVMSNFETKLQPSIASYIGYLWTKAVIEMAKNVEGKLTSQSLADAAKKYRMISFEYLMVSFENKIERKNRFRKILFREYK